MTLTLTNDQALVLFEMLAREDGAVSVQHPAEQSILWSLQGQLESALVELLRPDYLDLLVAARDRLSK